MTKQQRLNAVLLGLQPLLGTERLIRVEDINLGREIGVMLGQCPNLKQEVGWITSSNFSCLDPFGDAVRT